MRNPRLMLTGLVSVTLLLGVACESGGGYDREDVEWCREFAEAATPNGLYSYDELYRACLEGTR